MKKVYGWTTAMVLLGFVMAGVFLTIAPAEIPAHYSIRGEVDRWGSKYEMLILPCINLAFGVFMAFIAWNEGKHGRDMNAKIVGVMNVWILALFNALWAVFMWKAVDAENLGADLGDLTNRGIMVLLTASFIPMGNILPKAQRNAAFGLRTKWSMANDHCWQQSQRIGGYIMVACGVLGVILTAVLPITWAGIVMLVLITAMAVLSAYASYRIYMKNQNL